MTKQIRLNDENVEYTLKTSTRARHMRLAVYPGGGFVVTVPRRMGDSLVERFIFKHAEWVMKTLKKFRSMPVMPRARSTRKEYLEHKDAALKLVTERLKYFNQFYNFERRATSKLAGMSSERNNYTKYNYPWNKITIRNQKTRWGSCSRHGNLSFSYKLALLPPRHSDYIIIHELCHLGQFNHSANFWKLVAQQIPEHKAVRHELKRADLTLIRK
jgi:hypothetical protein